MEVDERADAVAAQQRIEPQHTRDYASSYFPGCGSTPSQMNPILAAVNPSLASNRASDGPNSVRTNGASLRTTLNPCATTTRPWRSTSHLPTRCTGPPERPPADADAAAGARVSA